MLFRSPAVTQLFTDDDHALDGQVHALVNQVGTVSVPNFGLRAVPRLVYTEADGDRVVVRLTGPGHGRVTSDADGLELAFNGTTALSTIAVVDKTAGGRAKLHNVSIDDVVGTVNLTTTNIDGYTTLSGGVQTLNLGNLTGDRILQIGTFLPTNSTAATIKIGSVTNYSLESDQPIATLTVASWRDTGGADDQLIAPSLGTLTVIGDMEANVTIEGRAAITAFTVGGFFRNATFLAEKAGLGSVTLGGMDHANLFLGTDDRPATLGDFTKTRTLTSFTITGTAAAGKVFIDSQVAAAHIGAISVLRVDPASGSGPFGFVADTIASYVRDGAAPLTNLSVPADTITTGNYLVKLL